MSSRTLFRMLCGHVYFTDILAITLSIGMLRQVQVPWPWRHMARTGIWQGFVTKSLNSWLRSPFPNRAWHFRHNDLGITAGRQLFGETTGHGRAALIGIAVYAGIWKPPVSQPCPFCHAEVPPVWHCVDPVLAQGRPEPPLDEVLGGRQIAAAPVLRVGTHVPMRACVREVVIFLFVWAMASCCAARALVGSC
jgi:hypothetical protein